ncbi:MAG: flagellar biosynthesis protein FlhB [Planctomycetaceae bacterium]|nr:flagellar biosynthesis protein FlhB [Planctomycetaceae bacterium]MCP4464048.1 flagellar biosynthesis protein FlhB [Planctomycetaceae bacterium]MDG1808156.1 flagellar biosynthesis protein FlhB [Pirellulaceae bacterium]MDG2103847.1 flagellar biosynthesis protein FlhB [Pirellulaceae bacterium]
MAGDNTQEKTQEPTQRKLDRSREEGQIAYSADLTGGVALLCTTLMFALLSDHFIKSLCRELVFLLGGFGPTLAGKSEYHWQFLLSQSTWNVSLICLPIMCVAFISTLLIGAIVTGFRPTPKALKFDVEKLSPVKGFSRIFSSRSVVKGIVAILKLVIISAITVSIIAQQWEPLGMGTAMTIEQSIESLVMMVILLMLGVSAGLVILGVADFGYQKWKHLQDMKMSLQEVIDERKDEEGDPMLRARRKRLHREMSQRQMLQDVASSTVVVTNPTHFAVALRYDRDKGGAPTVVAKGKDHLAFKIIEIAKANRVAVVQRKPLARAMYHNVPVGQEIPLELYQTVAEVLTYIYSIDRQAGRRY